MGSVGWSGGSGQGNVLDVVHVGRLSMPIMVLRAIKAVRVGFHMRLAEERCSSF